MPKETVKLKFSAYLNLLICCCFDLSAWRKKTPTCGVSYLKGGGLEVVAFSTYYPANNDAFVALAIPTIELSLIGVVRH